ncbi:Na+/H+ antiporter NhaC family protein [Salipaludibacillus daqingensis]|uniref:Na+/H+ antiporter NhaC family protein n=1 Tax=Salipaludibacillus daqingensis TaxID=3041001 RepID=UPI0024746C1E|nr:Na+/H+ antiporter NhaC family protein [Salipaludibacillus daqingensis]
MKQKTFTLVELLFIISVTVSSLITAILNDLSLVLAICPGLFLLVVISLRKGFSIKKLRTSSWTGVKRNKDVAWLLAFIGILLPTWYLAGTIRDLNDLSLSLIHPGYFFTITFVVTAIMSLIVGSAIGSLSIVGVPLIGAADILGFPLAIVGGALVSGAFVGDRTSPLSSSFFLLSHSLELTVRNHFKAIFPTMLWTTGLTTVIFLLFDLFIDKGTTGEEVLSHHLQEINFTSISISLLPPLVLLVMILAGKNMKITFSASIVTALIILVIRGVALDEWFHGIVFGVDAINGLQQMLPFILFILLVGAYSQMIEDTKLIQPYIEKIFTTNTALPINTSKSIAVAASVSLISPNQSFPIILTGRALLPYWQKHLSKRDLARTLADSTVVFAGLVPWSLLAILCSTIIGIPVLTYLPFAFFLLLSPLVTFFYSLGQYLQKTNRSN